MRLRSPQFVFLMLLLCSVQMRAECALHLVATAVRDQQNVSTVKATRRVAASTQQRDHRANGADPASSCAASKRLLQPQPAIGPVLEAMAMNLHTGLLRA